MDEGIAGNTYVTVNARIGYRLSDSFTISATAEQFDQDKIYQRASVPVERRAILTLSSSF